MKKRIAIIIVILLLAIGFATVSTTLIINGNFSIKKDDDFDVIFTAANLDGNDIYDTSFIAKGKKTITFTSSDLKHSDDKSVLTYTVTNKSNYSSADITIECIPLKSEHTSLNNVIKDDVNFLKASESLTGEATITLNKTATEEKLETYTCKLIATRSE